MTDETRTDEYIERIRAALHELGMPCTAEQFDEELRKGPADRDTRLHFLWRLLEPQLLHRRQRTVERRTDAARFPARKTLDNFDFDFQPTLDRARVLELAGLEFVRRGQNLLIGGMSGTGKSHIAIAIGYLACAAGFRTRYTTSADMLAHMHASLATGQLTEATRAWVRPQVLVVDEVGLDRPEQQVASDAQLFYRVMQPRYLGQLTTIITTNIDWETWGTYLGDDVATVAILDRLVHHGHLITINGPSWRAKEHAELNARPNTDPTPGH